MKQHHSINSVRRSFVKRFVVICNTLIVIGMALAVALTSTASSASAHSQSACPTGTQNYQIQQGDTLGQIAHVFGSSISTIATHNGITDVDLIFANASICISEQGYTSLNSVPYDATIVDAKTTITPQPAQQVFTYNQPAQSPSIMSNTSVVAIINRIFGPYASQATRVAQCESGLNPQAYNPAGPYIGVFQFLYPGTWSTTSQAANSPYDAYANVAAAYEVFARDGYSWRQWSCKP